nr:MAG TPA: hypothetical protein [Caudoviricetes sp.]
MRPLHLTKVQLIQQFICLSQLIHNPFGTYRRDL